MIKSLEYMHPKHLEDLNKNLLTLIKNRLWLQIIVGMLLGVLTGVLLGPSVGLIDKELASIVQLKIIYETI